MATDVSRVRQAAKLAVVLLVVGPLLVQLGFVGVELAPSVAFVPSVDADLLVRLVGLGFVLLVLVVLVRQKRRSRGQQASDGTPEQPEGQRGQRDQRVEGSGEVYAPYAYNNQQAARRESERIRDRAEEIAEAERDAYERRRK
ncbi:hypothetical protein BRD15_07020 [Halobacteriales archaeon SW_6_65_15]|jgi:hypothetical protein|nr:MAG: hypothetical protein BRD15_07020 [Halobacteriales archaeon SW_6_65_15]